VNVVFHPWQLLAAILAGWVNRAQQQRLEYQNTEMQVLREVLGTKRILLTDDQRRRLAVKGKVLGRKVLSEISTLFTPDTILRWHRQLVAQKWDYSAKRARAGRPATPQDVVDLVLRFAKENPTWGYDRIADDGKTLSRLNFLTTRGQECAPTSVEVRVYGMNQSKKEKEPCAI
jgi:putative transposase